MTENYIETIPIVGILIIACSFKIRKADFFTFRPQSSKGLDDIFLKAEKESLRWNSTNFVPRSLTIRKSGRKGSGQPKVTLVAYIIKIEDLPTFADIKTDKLIGFCVVDLLRNHLQMLNLSYFWSIFSILKIEK